MVYHLSFKIKGTEDFRDNSLFSSGCEVFFRRIAEMLTLVSFGFGPAKVSYKLTLGVGKLLAFS